MKKILLITTALFFLFSCNDDSKKTVEKNYFGPGTTLNIQGSYDEQSVWNLWRISDSEFYSSTATGETVPTSADIVWEKNMNQHV